LRGRLRDVVPMYLILVLVYLRASFGFGVLDFPDLRFICL